MNRSPRAPLGARLALDEDGSNRRENVTDWALEQFRTHYGDSGRASGRKPDVEAAGDTAKPRRADASTLANGASTVANEREISKWDIFYYVYGILHHPGYRTKFADNLKHELPRIPFAPTLAGRASDGASAKSS